MCTVHTLIIILLLCTYYEHGQVNVIYLRVRIDGTYVRWRYNNNNNNTDSRLLASSSSIANHAPFSLGIDRSRCKWGASLHCGSRQEP